MAGPSGAGFGGRKAPSGMGKISTLGILRLRATNAVFHTSQRLWGFPDAVANRSKTVLFSNVKSFHKGMLQMRALSWLCLYPGPIVRNVCAAAGSTSRPLAARLDPP